MRDWREDDMHPPGSALCHYTDSRSVGMGGSCVCGRAPQTPEEEEMVQNENG